MKNKSYILICVLSFWIFSAGSQNNTFSPYSRYGLGELAPTTFAHNTGMGGAFIAHKPDSTMPIFINAGNPAAYSLIRLTSLEVGGSFLYSSFKGRDNTALNKWGTNFAYGALGFPIRGNGGACFGILPYSQVGYETQTASTLEGIGSISYKYNGTGGLNKVFLGYGVMPFNKRLIKFRSSRLFIPDSLKTLSPFQFRARQFGNKLLSDLAIGANVNYIFGRISNTSRIVYPDATQYFNTYNERTLTFGDFTGNFGLQTALGIDSVKDPKRREDEIKRQITLLKEQNIFSEQQLNDKQDSLRKVTRTYRRAFKEKIKITFGYFATINNPLSIDYSTAAYNYILTNLGEEIVRDTVMYNVRQDQRLVLPMEQGFGLGFKKGERLNFVTDFAITDWTKFQYIENTSDLLKNYRVSAGINIVPEKYAAGRNAFLRRINYRLGVSYQTGYIKIKDAVVSNYFVSAGVGLPVGIGRLSSMVNITAQYGRTGTDDPTLIKENYWRINFGFTFSDKWFQKYRYD